MPQDEGGDAIPATPSKEIQLPKENVFIPPKEYKAPKEYKRVMDDFVHGGGGDDAQEILDRLDDIETVLNCGVGDVSGPSTLPTATGIDGHLAIFDSDTGKIIGDGGAAPSYYNVKSYGACGGAHSTTPGYLCSITSGSNILHYNAHDGLKVGDTVGIYVTSEWTYRFIAKILSIDTVALTMTLNANSPDDLPLCRALEDDSVPINAALTAFYTGSNTGVCSFYFPTGVYQCLQPIIVHAGFIRFWGDQKNTSVITGIGVNVIEIDGAVNLNIDHIELMPSNGKAGVYGEHLVDTLIDGGISHCWFGEGGNANTSVGIKADISTFVVHDTVFEGLNEGINITCNTAQHGYIFLSDLLFYSCTDNKHLVYDKTDTGLDINMIGIRVVSPVGGTTAYPALRMVSGKIHSVQGYCTGNSEWANVLGNVVRKMQIFDDAGASLGYIPIYDSITMLWYLAGGIPIANCVAAFQPKGAASLAASYINLVTPGTNDAAPGVAPTFAIGTGWTFDGATNWLTSTLAAEIQPVTFVARIVPTIGANSPIWGAAAGGLRFGISDGGTLTFGALGIDDCSNGSGTLTNGVASTVAISYNGTHYIYYIDGVPDSNGDHAMTPAAAVTNLGGMYNGLYQWYTGVIVAMSKYDIVLTPAQISALHSAMAAL